MSEHSKYIYALSLLAITLMLVTRLKVYEVQSNSMLKTIKASDYVLIWKGVGFSEYNAGSVVAFSRVGLDMKKVVFIKRIAATGNDTLIATNDGIKIKERDYPHDPVFLTIKTQFQNHQAIYFQMLFKQTAGYRASNFYSPTDSSVIVPEDFYFMIGDNFYESMDSRFWGFIHEDQIIGKVISIF